MKKQNQFNLSAIALAAATVFASGQAFAGTNEISPAINEGVTITSNNDGTPGEVFTITEGNRIILQTNAAGTTIQIGQTATSTSVIGDLSVAGALTASNLQSNATVTITGDTDNSTSTEGVVIKSNGDGSGGNLSVLDAGVSVSGGLNNNGSGITNAGAISGATTINASGLATLESVSTGSISSLGTVTITGNSNGISTGEGVFIGSNNIGSNNSSANNSSISVLDTGVVTVTGTSTLLNATATTVGGTLAVTGATTLSGATQINNTLGVTGLSTLGNVSSTGTLTQVGEANINVTGGATTNIATGAAATTNIGMVGGTNNLAGTTNINAGVNSATNINTGTSTGAVTIGNKDAGNITLQSAEGSQLVVGDTGTAVTGALSSTGNFSVGASKFTVDATNGNTYAAGTLNTVGSATVATADGTSNTFGSGANSTNTIGHVATSTNTITGATNTITGGTGNTITATTGNNAMIASAGNNNITASLINNIEAPTNNIGVATVNSINNIGNSAGSTNTIKGVTSINANIDAATNINTGTSISAVTIGNTGIKTDNTVNAYSGKTAMSLANYTASLTAGSTLATNGDTGVTSGTGSGGLTVYNSAQTIADQASIPTALSPNGILAGKTYQNKINGNLLVDGNVYINGTLDYVSSNTANTTVIGGAGTSNLVGATSATTGGTAIVMKGATGTQTVVDANGKLTNVVGTATQSTAALTLTNGMGNTHGLVITETQASLSGGANSSTLTMADNGGTFSDAQTGAPVQVHGVNDGTSDFDAVNVRQFSSAIASVTAMANIPQVDQDKKVAVGVAVGSFMGKSALAAGVTYRFTKNGVLKGSISSAMNSSQTTAVGLGAAWSY